VGFVRTYLVALVALCVVAAIALGVVAVQRLLTPDYGQPRPTPAALKPYALSFSGPSANGSATIDVDAAQCDKLKPSQFLVTVCTLALNEDPAFIAAEAFGDLNNRDTPSYEAIIWRALLDGDPAICDQGGLLDQRLATCRALVSAGNAHSVTDSGVTATIEPARTSGGSWRR
jgi:hypothetical protein